MASAKEGNGAPTKKTKLYDLYEQHGLSPWYDNLCRPVTDLLPLIAFGVRGVTSNPTVTLRRQFFLCILDLTSVHLLLNF
jgi:transaldolase